MRTANSNLREQLIELLEVYLERGCNIPNNYQTPDNFNENMGNNIPLDPEHGDIFDP